MPMDFTTGNLISMIVYIVTLAVAWGTINEKVKNMAKDILRLETKQDKHNSLVERIAKLEQRVESYDNIKHCECRA